jgi:hypothetical protein
MLRKLDVVDRTQAAARAGELGRQESDRDTQHAQRAALVRGQASIGSQRDAIRRYWKRCP